MQRNQAPCPVEAGCHKCAGTCTQCVLKKLWIHAQGLQAQLVSLPQERKNCFKICKSISCLTHKLCIKYECTSGYQCYVFVSVNSLFAHLNSAEWVQFGFQNTHRFSDSRVRWNSKKGQISDSFHIFLF